MQATKLNWQFMKNISVKMGSLTKSTRILCFRTNTTQFAGTKFCNIYKQFYFNTNVQKQCWLYAICYM